MLVGGRRRRRSTKPLVSEKNMRREGFEVSCIAERECRFVSLMVERHQGICARDTEGATTRAIKGPCGYANRAVWIKPDTFVNLLEIWK